VEKELINVLLIEDNPGDTRLIQELFSEAKGIATALLCADRLSSGLKQLAEGGVDVVLLDLSLPDSKGFDTFTRLRAGARDLPVILLTGLDDEELAMRAVREGAQDYLVKGSVTSQSLARSVRFAVERHKTKPADPGEKRRTAPGRVLGFLGAKGGVGATTLVLNAAATLARQHKSVIALDLRLFGGSFSLQTQLTPRRNLRHLLDLDAERITEAELKSCLVSLPSGAGAIFSPRQPDQAREIQPAQAEDIIRCAARMVDYVIVDLPPQFCQESLAAVKSCDLIALVVEQNSASVTGVDSPSSCSATQASMRAPSPPRS
jgi:Flp pilus assembly CpaE family ATPase